MKILLLSIIMIASAIVHGRVIILPKNADGGLYKPKHDAHPGDTILLSGDYAYIFLENVEGRQGKPVVITNKDRVRIGIGTNNYSFLIINSNYVHIDGNGNKEFKYGFLVGGIQGTFNSQGFSFGGGHFEINGLEIQNSQLGFFSNARTGGPWKGLFIHNNYVHGLDNPLEQGRSEGVYVGNTEPSTYISAGSFDSVEISNNIFENLSGDGIQVARSRHLKIHDNTIRNYGKANLEQQRSGIIIGGCSSGVVSNNKILHGTGAAIQVFGAGNVDIINNTIQQTATSASEDAIYINGKCLDGPKLKVRLINNTIDHANREFVKDANPQPSIIEKKGNVFGKKKS
jgi:hypothetical protein